MTRDYTLDDDAPARDRPGRERDDVDDYETSREVSGDGSGNGSHEPARRLGYRPPDTQAVLAAICPYLLAEDGAWRAARPVREHRCTAVRPPASLPYAKQRRLCLIEAHRACPAFQAAQDRRASELAAAGISTSALAARQTRPLTRTIPVALDRPTAVTGPTALVGAYRRLGTIGLSALILLAVLLLVFARFGGNAQAPGPSPTPTPFTGVVPTAPPATASPTAIPSASSTPPPTQGRTPTPAPTPTVYVVQRGDSLTGIANRYDTTVEALQRLNGIAPGQVIQPGQKIKIPVPGAPTPAPKLYTVQRGDTLTSIAQRFGTTVDAIKRLNNLSSGFIRTGQVLRIP